MKLYKDYKEELDRTKKEEEDRKAIGAGKDIVIVYEPSKATSILKASISFFIFFLVLLGVGFVTVFLALRV